MPPRLPPLPLTNLEVLEDHTSSSRCDEGFIRLRRQKLCARFPDGTVSEAFTYDEVQRSALDAVVIAAHFRDDSGELQVFLRSALRPPAAMRPKAVCPIPERPNAGHLWEVPAGLVEKDERSEQGLRSCAARELAEELGLRVDPADMNHLGPATFPAPALIGERHFYFHCRVDPNHSTPPPGDGSPLEHHATIISVPMVAALELVRNGEIEDAKTEIALRRLAELPL